MKAQHIKDTHFILISDIKGIGFAFNQLKILLGKNNNNYLSLIYYLFPKVSAHPLFKSELESIEKRFSSKLLVYYAHYNAPSFSDESCANQQILEVVINSNTLNQMQFQVFGNSEFIEIISERLHFLGIKENQIILNHLNK